MKTDPSATSGTFCVRCRSVGDSQAVTCWMCGSTDLRQFGPATSAAPSEGKDPAWHLGDEIAGPRPHPGPKFVKTLVAVIGVILAVCFLLGVWQESPGLGVILTLIIGVVILTTVGHGGASSDPDARAAGSILRIFAGVATTLATISLIVVVSVVAMFCFALVTCLGMLKGGS